MVQTQTVHLHHFPVTAIAGRAQNREDLLSEVDGCIAGTGEVSSAHPLGEGASSEDQDDQNLIEQSPV
jgi:hypothetical protein